MITVFIADDHPIVREGIISLLNSEPDISVVGQATDGEEAVEKILELCPDVVIIDISMPKLNGLDATKKLFESSFNGKVIVLSQHEKEEYIRIATQVGVSGYLVKYSLKQEVLDAVRTVAAGDVYFSASVSKVLITESLHRAKRIKKTSEDIQLTERELEVLRFIAEGFSSRQIAEKMFISARTVDFHRVNIISKLGIRDVAGLTRYALKHGLIKM